MTKKRLKQYTNLLEERKKLSRELAEMLEGDNNIVSDIVNDYGTGQAIPV